MGYAVAVEPFAGKGDGASLVHCVIELQYGPGLSRARWPSYKRWAKISSIQSLILTTISEAELGLCLNVVITCCR